MGQTMPPQLTEVRPSMNNATSTNTTSFSGLNNTAVSTALDRAFALSNTTNRQTILMRKFDTYHYYGLTTQSKAMMFVTKTVDLYLHQCKQVSDCKDSNTVPTCCAMIDMDGKHIAMRCMKKTKYQNVKLDGREFTVNGCPEPMMMHEKDKNGDSFTK